MRGVAARLGPAHRRQLLVLIPGLGLSGLSGFRIGAGAGKIGLPPTEYLAMQVPFSEFPGRHERHYRRRLDNALFPRPVELSNDDLLEAQRLDHEELIRFLGELREAVQSAVALKPNEESQVILDLKTRLDRLYEAASCLAEDQSGNKDALRQLISVIMGTVRAAAAGDATAAQELQQEDLARATHFRLLEQPLVAELLHPQSLIQQDELLPTLLSESETAVIAALELFDAEQLALLAPQARELLSGCDAAQRVYPAAWQRLERIEAKLKADFPG